MGILTSLMGWGSPIENEKNKSYKEVEKSWIGFRGAINTDEVLIEKAKALALVLVALIHESTKSLFEELKKDKGIKIEDRKFVEVFFESALFYLSVIDRVAFKTLGADKGSVFAKALFIEFSESLAKTYESDVESARFRSAFEENYTMRRQEYAGYKKLFPDKNDKNMNDTLLGKFGKQIVEVLGSKKDIAEDFLITTSVDIRTMYFIAALDLVTLFSEQN